MERISTRWLVQVAVLAAIIVVMSVTPLGYLKVGTVEITFLMIPVIIGSIVIGVKAGTILGAIWGFTSFLQCFGASAFGTMLFSYNPFYTFIVCLVPRVLMGLLVGLLFKAIYSADKTPGSTLAFSFASIVGPLLNTLLFVGGVFLMFWNEPGIVELRGGMNVLAFFVAFVGVNGLVEAIVSFFVGAAVSRAVYKYVNK